MAMLLYGMALTALAVVVFGVCKFNVSEEWGFGETDGTDSSGPMPVFAISLARTPHRRARLMKQTRGVRFIRAVDGASLDHMGPVQPDGERELTRGERGCFLSHVKAWKAIRETWADVALLLEDDADIRLPDQWPELLQMVRECPDPEWDVIFLGVNDYPIDTSPRVSPQLRQMNSHAYGAHAMLVSRKGVHALLNHYATDQLRVRGVELPLDFWITEQPLRMYWADPKLVKPFDEGISETMGTR